MIVMTLCVLVYKVAQYKLRETLKQNKDTLPNPLGKEVRNPTLRWIFQAMEGISVVRLQTEQITSADIQAPRIFIPSIKRLS